MPDLRAEVWARPGAATFEKIWEDPQATRFGGTVRVSGTGDGEMTLPDLAETPTLADLLCLTDPDTPANSTAALIRVYSDGQAGPVHEWRVTSVVPPTSDQDPNWEVGGLDTFDFLNDAAIEPWDWDGGDDFDSLMPDWVWGGRNLVGEIADQWRPHTFENWWSTGATGSYKLGVSLDGGAYQWTGNIAVGSTAPAVDVLLTALGYVDDVSVSGEGTESNPFRIQMLAPQGLYVVAIDVGLITAGTAYISLQEFGEELPKGWEPSKSYISGLDHGLLTIFRLSDGTGSDPALPACDTAGWSIAWNGTEPRFPGIQKPLKVKPGGIYQGSVWVYAQGASADLRFVIRDLAEGGIAANPNFSDGVTIPSNTWTQMTLTNVQIPTNVDEILFRIGHVGTGDPPMIFTACAEFNEGLPAATIGDIWDQLYDDAVTNHAGDGRICWEDESAGLPGNVFLVLDFTTILDSAGQAWTDSDVSITGKRGWSYGRFMRETIGLGYEARIVPAATDGQWKLQIYNPGTLGTVRTGDDFVGVRVGRDVIRRTLRRFIPVATAIEVEGGNQQFSRRENTTAITAVGRRERYLPERDYNTLIETGLAATDALSKALKRGRSIQPVLMPGPDDPEPLVDWVPGDTIDVRDADNSLYVSARAVAISYTKVAADGAVTYEPAFSSESFVGQDGINQGVRELLEAQDAIRREPPKDSPDQAGIYSPYGGAGGGFTLRIAAADATERSKASAWKVCDGVDDHVEIQAAIDHLAVWLAGEWGGGRVLLSEGEFHPDWGQIVIPSSASQIAMEGMGRQITVIDMNDMDASGSGTAIEVNNLYATLKNFSLWGPGSIVAGQKGIVVGATGDHVIIEEIMMQYFDVGIENAGDWVEIKSCWLELANDEIVDTGDYTRIHDTQLPDVQAGNAIKLTGSFQDVYGNLIDGVGEHGIVLSGTSDARIHDNLLFGCSGDVDDTYDGILLEGDSDDNYVHHNTVLIGAGNVNRYGINVSAATCNGNIVVANDLRSSYGTAPLNDAGTGTLLDWPSHPTYGDNFTDTGS